MLEFHQGEIYHRHFTTTVPPKDKFFVVMGIKDDKVIGYFFINSNINPCVSIDTEKVKLQLPVFPKDYPFLTHQSFIAGEVLSVLDKSVLENEIRNGRAKYKGKLKRQDLDLLLMIIFKSSLYDDRQKKFFK